MSLSNREANNLISKLRKIARAVGVNEKDLIVDEIRAFVREHKDHGLYDITLSYSGSSGNIETIYLECSGDQLVDNYSCPHRNPNTPSEESFSIIYSNRPVAEIAIQKQRCERKKISGR